MYAHEMRTGHSFCTEPNISIIAQYESVNVLIFFWLWQISSLKPFRRSPSIYLGAAFIFPQLLTQPCCCTSFTSIKNHKEKLERRRGAAKGFKVEELHTERG